MKNKPMVVESGDNTFQLKAAALGQRVKPMRTRFAVVGFILGLLMLTLFAINNALAATETMESQNAAMYEFFMFGEENNLRAYAGRETVGKPWTVEYDKDRKGAAELIWTVKNCDTLTEAVVRAESDFVKYQNEGFDDQCTNR